ncbi:MAG: (4Fe-4S)-binding protein [Phaeodactylibacter sp.]|nr:(4Fe-4S)-binding protein [Phaeodactylibacter sp.]MCB9299576.1 (4Fe-4S)-binding protein [Lewinellaceae bacterium]HQU60477.1 (4Fe-4S)-binding protein [Saprospiraceae bacterium]
MSEKESPAKEYSNGEVTVVWKPRLCMHSEMCFKGLPEVFDPKARPWVNVQGADTERIVQQVKKCPSGALSFFFNQEKSASPAKEQPASIPTVEPTPNGPLMVHGPIDVKHSDGSIVRKEKAAFCRCGASGNKPFCDGSHRRVGFEG